MSHSPKAGVRVVVCLMLMAFLGMGLFPRAAQAEQPDASPDDGLLDRDKLLDHLEAELGTITSLVVAFEQEKHLAIFEAPVGSTGRLMFKAPNAIRFEICTPFRSVLIVSGTGTAKYEGFDDGWKKMRLGNTETLVLVMEQVALWFQGKFREQDGIFDISLEGTIGEVLVLTPKRKRFRQFISRIELTLDDDRKRFTSMVIRESEGDFTRLRFLEEKRQNPIPPNFFDVTRAQPVVSPIPTQASDE